MMHGGMRELATSWNMNTVLKGLHLERCGIKTDRVAERDDDIATLLFNTNVECFELWLRGSWWQHAARCIG